jgi:predicted dehydrogenase
MAKRSTVNVAVIGAGAIGLNHIESFQKHPDARVVAVAETSPLRGREAVERFNVPELVSDYHELLGRRDIDVVSIALPNFLHAGVSIEALNAGKHVMLDKPMATNARDAARVLAAAKKNRRKFMVGQNQRFTKEAQAVKKLVVDGKLGEVYHAKAVWLRRSGIPRIGSWFTQTEFAGGGCTYDIGVHALDLALHLMGEFDAVSVSGQTYAKYGPRGLGEGTWGKSEVNASKPFDVDDFCVALIKLKSGRTVQLEVSWAAGQEQRDVNGVQLFGTEGGARTNPLTFSSASPSGFQTTEIKPIEAFAPDNRMAHFIDFVRGKAKPFVLPEQSLMVQKILDAIYKSAGSGREVRIR